MRKEEPEDVLGPQRPARQEENHGRVHAAGDADDHPLEPPAAHHLVLQEHHQGRLHQRGVDLQGRDKRRRTGRSPGEGPGRLGVPAVGRGSRGIRPDRASPPRRPVQGPPQHGQHSPQVRKEGPAGPDPRDLAHREFRAHASGGEERSPCEQLAVGTPRRRSAREQLPPFRPRQLGSQHEDSVLPGGARPETVPRAKVGRQRRRSGARFGPAQGRRDRCRSVGQGPKPPRRRRRHAQHGLGAVQGQHGGGQAVPQVLAHEQAHPPEPRVERPQVATGLHEPPLVEETVGGQEELAVDVHHLVPAPARRQIGGAVAEAMPVPLVEPQDHVAAAARRRLAHRFDQLGPGQRHFLHAALQDVARERRLREDDQVGGWVEHRLGRLDVPPHVALGGLRLGQDRPKGTPGSCERTGARCGWSGPHGLARKLAGARWALRGTGAGSIRRLATPRRDCSREPLLCIMIRNHFGLGKTT